MTSPRSHKIVPQNAAKEKTAWSDHERERCKNNLAQTKEKESLLNQDKTKIIMHASSLTPMKTKSQYFVKIDVKDSEIKKIWYSDDGKHLESETLLISDCSPKAKASKISRRTTKLIQIIEKIYTYLPKLLIIVSLLQIGLFVWDKGLRKWLVYSPSQRQQVWRFGTYALMHSDVLHVTLNVVLQILIGLALEHEQGRLRTAVVYIGGCVAGAMGSSVLQPMLYICGSSGGIYAMLLSHLAHIWLNRRTISFLRYRIIIVATLVISDAAYTIAHWLIYTNTNPTISLPAHGVGATSGVFIGMIIYKGTDNGDVSTKIATVFSAVILLSFLVFTILCNLRYINIFNR